MMPMLRDAKHRYETALEFTSYIRCAGAIMVAGSRGEAAELLEAKGWKHEADAIRKAAVAATTAGSSGMNVTTFLGSFMQLLRNSSAFDLIAANAFKVPAHFAGRVTIFSNAASSAVAEGAAKTVKSLTLAASDFTPTKTAVQVVLSKEMIDALEDEGLRVLGNELKAAVAVGSDAALLTALAGNSGEAMGLDSWQGISDDLEELLTQLNLGAGSRPFFITSPAMAKRIAVKAMTNGAGATLAWDGGSFAGVPIVVSDAQTSNRITAVDATGLAVVAGEIELRSTDQALVEMVDSSSQTSGTSVNAVQMVSMFQTNSRALRAERGIAVKAIRPGAHAHLTGVALGQGSDSPQAI